MGRAGIAALDLLLAVHTDTDVTALSAHIASPPAAQAAGFSKVAQLHPMHTTDTWKITQSFGTKALAAWLRQHISRVPLTTYPRELELRPLHCADDSAAVIGRLARRTVLAGHMPENNNMLIACSGMTARCRLAS